MHWGCASACRVQGEHRVLRDFALNNLTGESFPSSSLWFLNLKINNQTIFYLVWILFGKYESFKKNTKDIFKKNGKNNSPPSLGKSSAQMNEGAPLTSLTGGPCFLHPAFFYLPLSPLRLCKGCSGLCICKSLKCHPIEMLLYLLHPLPEMHSPAPQSLHLDISYSSPMS